MKEEIVCPIVHLNGTSEEELIELRSNFLQKLREAREALSEMSPNGRDYYPVDGLFQKAMEQHRKRDAVLEQLMSDIREETSKIMGD